MYTKLF